MCLNDRDTILDVFLYYDFKYYQHKNLVFEKGEFLTMHLKSNANTSFEVLFVSVF